MKNGYKRFGFIKGNVLSKIVFLTIILIFILTFFLLSCFVKQMNHTLKQISTSEIKRLTNTFITERLNYDLLNEDNLANILKIEKNEQGQIIYVDFNLDQAYQVLDQVSLLFTKSFKEIENGNASASYLDSSLSHDLGCMVLSVPFGNTFENLYFYNWGPKIPVRIHFVGSVLTNLKTKVTSYGINNALVELFCYAQFKIQIMSPFDVDEYTFEYDAVIASMMIEGRVPSYYGGVIEGSSNIYSKEIK